MRRWPRWRPCSCSRRCGGGDDGDTAATATAAGDRSLPGRGGRQQRPRPLQLRPLGPRRVRLHRHLGRAAPGTATSANVVYIWSLDAAGAPTLVDSVEMPGIDTVSDVAGERRRRRAASSARRAGRTRGLYVYDLTDPRTPAFLDSALVDGGVHTATIAEIGGRRYVFAARNPPDPALLIYDITDPAAITSAATVPIPPAYGIHDTYVRDGLAFVFAWNTGVIIYDVGNGIAGGSPADAGGGEPAGDGGRRRLRRSGGAQRLVVPQPGDGRAALPVHRAGGAGRRSGSQSSGDIHVVDVSDLAHPAEVAFFHLAGAGTHNFWMDEARQILYAAYYNGGVVALDVSGQLLGRPHRPAASRRSGPAARATPTPGASSSPAGRCTPIDMLSGLWQLAVP